MHILKLSCNDWLTFPQGISSNSRQKKECPCSIQTWEETDRKYNVAANAYKVRPYYENKKSNRVVYLCYKKEVQVLSCVNNQECLLPREVEEYAIKAKLVFLPLEIRAWLVIEKRFSLSLRKIEKINVIFKHTKAIIKLIMYEN